MRHTVIRSTRIRRIYVVYAETGLQDTTYTGIDRISPSYMRDRVPSLLIGIFDFSFLRIKFGVQLQYYAARRGL